MSFTSFLKRIVLREKSDSKSYIDFLRKKGISIGDDCVIYVPSKTFIDVQYPWMITIGNHVKITEGVKLLTHDYSWSVLKRYSTVGIPEGLILGASGEISIGDHVFIGMNAVILRNVHIGNNVIIGAGSVVSKDCADNGIYAGNPAKFIMSMDDFFKKRREKQLEEARLLGYRYWQRYGKAPTQEVFHEYFMLFSSNEDILQNKVFLEKINQCGNGIESMAYVKQNVPQFNGYAAFWEYCKNYYELNEREGF